MRLDAPIQRSDVLHSQRKRAFDLIGATTLIIALAPVWIVVAVLVKMSSAGPVIFRQERVGLGGKSFVAFKFRTMRHGVDESAHRAHVLRQIQSAEPSGEVGDYKLAGDDRITAVGRFLRKTSLDELPQLLNVLKGEMSLIGPRPPIPYEVAQYQPWQLERLSVRPGLTGLWQVSGRNRLSYNDMCRLDLEYIRNWTFRRDLVIALKTPWVMLVDPGGAS